MTTTRPALCALLWLASCHAAPGEPDRARLHTPEDFATDDAPLPGVDPFEAGEERLCFGVFHDGPCSAEMPVDGAGVHFYIYELRPGGPLTFQMVPDRDRVDGRVADRLLHGGHAWWGGGLHFDVPRDLSGWDDLHVSLRSRSEAFAEVEVSFGSGSGSRAVNASAYGYAADGDWHSLVIPLADFADLSVDLRAVTDAVVLGGGAGLAGEALKVDGVFLTRD
jgi:hypothetical protein